MRMVDCTCRISGGQSIRIACVAPAPRSSSPALRAMNSRLAMVRAERVPRGNSTLATGLWSSALRAERVTRFCGSTLSSVSTRTLMSLSMLERIFFAASPIGRGEAVPAVPTRGSSPRPHVKN